MSNLILLFVCLIIGIVLKKSKIIPDNFHTSLNAFVINISLSAFSLYYISKIELNSSVIYPVLVVWIGIFAAILFFAGLGKIFGWKSSLIGALIMCAGFGNTSFVGIPLIQAMYGEEVDAQRHNHLIDRAIFHQHEVPADADSDHGGNIGEEENRAERNRALCLVQRQRQGNGAHQRQRHVNQRIENSVLQRNAKVNAVEEVQVVAVCPLAGNFVRLENFREILQSDKMGIADVTAVPLHERQQDCANYRDEREDSKPQKVRCEKRVGNEGIS